MINISITSRSTRPLQKIAKTKLKPPVWVFDWWESCLESTLDLDSAALALDTISPIVRAFSEGLASARGWTPLPFAFSSGQETPTSPFFFLFKPLLESQSPKKGLGWWKVDQEEEGEGQQEEEEQLDPLWYLLHAKGNKYHWSLDGAIVESTTHSLKRHCLNHLEIWVNYEMS